MKNWLWENWPQYYRSWSSTCAYSFGAYLFSGRPQFYASKIEIVAWAVARNPPATYRINKLTLLEAPYFIPNSVFILVLIGNKIKANFDLIESRYLINSTKVKRNKMVDGIIYHALIFLSRNVWIPIPVIVPYNRMLCNM